MNLILLGKPGAGKGTLSKEFMNHDNYLHISTGDIFRKEISLKTELGILADSYISKGQLCPDDVTSKIIENVIKSNLNKSFIFDGFPRTTNQAIALKEILNKYNLKLDACINLICPDEIVIERLSSRLTCKNCNAIYNTRNNNPKIKGICDICGGTVYQRDDDKIESIKARLDVYENKTKPLIDFYKKENILIDVDGLLNGPELFKVITEKVIANNTSSSL